MFSILYQCSGPGFIGRLVFAPVFIITLALIHATTSRPSLAQSDADEARAFVQRFGDLSIKELTDKSTSEEQLSQRFAELYRLSFDSPAIATFVMGRHWRRMSDKEKAEFIDLFERFIIKTYSERFRLYNGETFEITGVRPQKNGVFVVSGNVRRDADSPPIAVEWRVGKKGDSFKFYDITIEGVSMAISQRSEFASVVKNQGGVEGLMTALREKVAE